MLRAGLGAGARDEGAVGVALGLVVVLLLCGVIEAFVTPSPLPTWARIGIGVTAWTLFMAYVFIAGRRAYEYGDTGDLDEAARGLTVPTAR